MSRIRALLVILPLVLALTVILQEFLPPRVTSLAIFQHSNESTSTLGLSVSGAPADEQGSQFLVSNNGSEYDNNSYAMDLRPLALASFVSKTKWMFEDYHFDADTQTDWASNAKFICRAAALSAVKQAGGDVVDRAPPWLLPSSAANDEEFVSGLTVNRRYNFAFVRGLCISRVSDHFHVESVRRVISYKFKTEIDTKVRDVFFGPMKPQWSLRMGLGFYNSQTSLVKALRTSPMKEEGATTAPPVNANGGPPPCMIHSKSKIVFVHPVRMHSDNVGHVILRCALALQMIMEVAYVRPELRDAFTWTGTNTPHWKSSSIVFAFVLTKSVLRGVGAQGMLEFKNEKNMYRKLFAPIAKYRWFSAVLIPSNELHLIKDKSWSVSRVDSNDSIRPRDTHLSPADLLDDDTVCFQESFVGWGGTTNLIRPRKGRRPTKSNVHAVMLYRSLFILHFESLEAKNRSRYLLPPIDSSLEIVRIVVIERKDSRRFVNHESIVSALIGSVMQVANVTRGELLVFGQSANWTRGIAGGEIFPYLHSTNRPVIVEVINIDFAGTSVDFQAFVLQRADIVFGMKGAALTYGIFMNSLRWNPTSPGSALRRRKVNGVMIEVIHAHLGFCGNSGVHENANCDFGLFAKMTNVGHVALRAWWDADLPKAERGKTKRPRDMKADIFFSPAASIALLQSALCLRFEPPKHTEFHVSSFCRGEKLSQELLDADV